MGIKMIRKYSTAIKDKFFVTTPIYYVNASPHIGHLYSSVIADATQRWQKILNPNAFIKFCTGTDEHGTKIQQAASKNNVSLPEYCSSISEKYRSLSNLFNIGYTDFIRTTEERHKTAVKTFWESVHDRGHIYSSKYAGWYCISDESFLTESQLKEIDDRGEKRLVSAESGHPVEWVEEQNYMFRLSSFRDNLIHWLTNNERSVRPKLFHKILLDSIMSQESLPDVSISRPTSRVHWGISVPGDDSQTIYVWMDALVNYLTATGYPDKSFRDAWPPDVQVIGKDILKFHGIYWPAFLMAADLEPPRSLFCHSHWTVDNEKMSKSKMNVVCPINRSEIYTTEGLRYFLLREGVAHSDGNYSDTKVIRILNSELADTLGNLLSRCTGTALNPNQVFPEIEEAAFRGVSAMDVTMKLMESVNELPGVCELHYNDGNFYKVADAVIATLHKANLFFETMKPWELKKNPSSAEQLNAVLHITLETLKVCGILLQPMIPRLAENLLNKINVPKDRRSFECSKSLSWNYAGFATVPLATDKSVLFRRIVLDKEPKVKAKKG